MKRLDDIKIPIELLQIGSDYWFVQISLSQKVFRPQHCVWSGYTLDKVRYLSNYYTTEAEARRAADRMNALLKAMVQPEGKLEKPRGRARKAALA